MSHRTQWEHRLRPFYRGRASECPSELLAKKHQLVGCGTEGCRHDIKHGTIAHMLLQGAPLRCQACRYKCWKCGAQHRNSFRTDSTPDMCHQCQRTELLETMNAYSEGGGLPYQVEIAALDHIELHSGQAYLHSSRVHGPLWPHAGEVLVLVAALLRKAPQMHHRIPSWMATTDKAISVLRSLGVNEHWLNEFKTKARERHESMVAQSQYL